MKANVLDFCFESMPDEMRTYLEQITDIVF